MDLDIVKIYADFSCYDRPSPDLVQGVAMCLKVGYNRPTDRNLIYRERKCIIGGAVA